MSTSSINKSELIRQIMDRLSAELESIEKSAKAAHEAATHEESRSEDSHDTRGIEAGYLAGAQSARAAELKKLLVLFRDLPVRDFAVGEMISVGALVRAALDEKPGWFFLVGSGAAGMHVEQVGQKSRGVCRAGIPKGCDRSGNPFGPLSEFGALHYVRFISRVGRRFLLFAVLTGGLCRSAGLRREFSLLLDGVLVFAFCKLCGASALRGWSCLAAPLALTGGFKTLISKPVLSWVASVALILAGTHTLQLQSGGVDPLLGAWLVALGFLLKRSAWGALKSKANFKVFRPGEFPGAGPVPGFEGGFDRSMDQDRFAQARDVVVEPVAQVGRSESKGRISH